MAVSGVLEGRQTRKGDEKGSFFKAERPTALSPYGQNHSVLVWSRRHGTRRPVKRSRSNECLEKG